PSSLFIIPPPPISTLFPYTTLFRSRMLIEQIATRPTAEINGLIGGYTGEGAKTVIPGQATAKVSFRLVGAQDPNKIRDAFRAFRSEEHTSELQSLRHLVCRLLLEKK